MMQFVDDVMDFTSTASMMGKPSLNDLRGGIATAPVLYAAEDHPELSPMILRRFSNDGDVDRAAQLVLHSNGIPKTRNLAQQHATAAAEAVSITPK